MEIQSMKMNYLHEQVMLSLGGQSGYSPTCSPIDFVVPGIDTFHFVAWGCDQGYVNVGYFDVSSCNFSYLAQISWVIPNLSLGFTAETCFLYLETANKRVRLSFLRAVMNLDDFFISSCVD